MLDEDLRLLEFAAREGAPDDVERYLAARIRSAPDLLQKFVRRLIRLERVVVAARANEDVYYQPVALDDFLQFLEAEAPAKPTEPGFLRIEGQSPSKAHPHAGGFCMIIGGRNDQPAGQVVDVPPTNAELYAMVLALTARVVALEGA